MHISVVIPTCNRKERLISLLQNLQGSLYPILEVVVVDSGEDRLEPADIALFGSLTIHYLLSEKSVCIQRNKGIQMARGEWIFLCDDDIEVPANYLLTIADHVKTHPSAGAVSGLVLQKEGTEWQASYPERSVYMLWWKYFFQLSLWGEIVCTNKSWLTQRIKSYYKRKGNHLSKAGWPVITDISGDYFIAPVYGLGASVIRKDWLLQSPYDEVLDRHGIGDNYGVAIGLPEIGIHVLNHVHVYHHQESINRLQRPIQYYRRMLALHYFMKTKERLKPVKKRWLLWSLTGNLLTFIRMGDKNMIYTVLQSIWHIALDKNPYYQAARANKKVAEPFL